jgi:hypothetical protein
MAIKISTPVVTPSGVSVTGLEATYQGRYAFKSLQVQEEKKYEVTANVMYYFDRSRVQVFNESVVLVIPPEEVNNVWSLLYGYLKNKYPRYIDC